MANSDLDNWNDDIESDLRPQDLDSIRVFSRDWTVETIASQIEKGNIDLIPKFQRRNAWTDARRSKLIESLIINIPVPEIVLAENGKNSFIVIDGKQRLLTIAGFMFPEKYEYWRRPKLVGLSARPDLNTKSYEDISSRSSLKATYTAFMNADVRCTVISNFSNEEILYDIFYRLNTGSVPLSTQELRQVLNKGPFADFLTEATDEFGPIHHVLGLSGADDRMRDIELVLRFICFRMFPKKYTGNLKSFLDQGMRFISSNWGELETEVQTIFRRFNRSIKLMENVFPGGYIGRKYSQQKGWESRFNKVLFEVEAFYFSRIRSGVITDEGIEEFISGFQRLCQKRHFSDAIESTTKTLDSYRVRYEMFGELFNKSFSTKIGVPNFGSV